MPSNLHTHDLVLQLKASKEEQHLSNQDIEEMLLDAGYHVSPNSIRKVFLEGSEDFGFRYRDTLEPIRKVLMNKYDDLGDTEALALKADLDVKDELIERRERELEESNKKLEECTKKLSECREDARQRIDYLKHQIELKDQRIDKLMARVDVLLKQVQDLLGKME